MRTASMAVLAGLLVVAAGCDPPHGPRHLEWPTFDARQPFPELASAAPAAQAAQEDEEGPGEDSAYERAIARELGGGSAEGAPVAVATTGSAQLVPLAGTFVADVPVEGDEWQWSTDGGVTLIVHREAGAAPDALIYVEGFSTAVDRFPSYEVGRFQYTVDPRLSTNVIYPPLVGVGIRALRERTSFPPVDVALALQKATTRTSGVGIGYTSTPGSFTGWRWVGHNKHGLDMRLGRTSGAWGAAFAQGDPTALQLLNVIARQVPELRQVADNMGEVMRGGQTGRAGALAPSWMVLGSVQKGESLGVHIAIVCERQPVCAVASDLSRFVASVRQSEGSIQTGPGGRADLLALASEAGFHLLPADKVIEAPQMVVLLEQAIARQRAEAGGGGTAIPGLPVELPPGMNIPGLPGVPGSPGGSGAPRGPAGLPFPVPGLPPGSPDPTEALRNLNIP
jgi:hypothetical protein